MTSTEIQNAAFVTLPFEVAVAVTMDEAGDAWYHVTEKREDGKWYSTYRAASFEDAMDVYGALLS